MKEENIFSLISRKRAEEAVPETDCSGKKYEDWLREDIIRYVQYGAEIQRDKDQEVVVNKMLKLLKKLEWKFGDLYEKNR